jgi:hypothetical protein
MTKSRRLCPLPRRETAAGRSIACILPTTPSSKPTVSPDPNSTAVAAISTSNLDWGNLEPAPCDNGALNRGSRYPALDSSSGSLQGLDLKGMAKGSGVELTWTGASERHTANCAVHDPILAHVFEEDVDSASENSAGMHDDDFLKALYRSV